MAKVLMIQGTMSNVGKSLLTAALCRIFKQDGYRVAPFKSQNMALNSYITKEGLEMGRAQAVQAMACGLEPSVRMNPILLKPTTDMGSQVIVCGRPIANMSAREYFGMKKQLVPQIMNAFDELAGEHDIIVVEGAGSPAEINLKKDDIVNMGLAKMLDAKVLLVGDIDRGGVFAQLYGTMELLECEERQRIKGMIINKFRGDRKLLEPGIRMIEEKCDCPVLGVVPYTPVDIEDEDSLSVRLKAGTPENPGAFLHIAVVKLPRISNFTDFAPFYAYDGVQVSYVTKPCELEQADLLILPGTKSTMEDLRWLRETGMEMALIRYAQSGRMVFGICGGYQILGRTIRDPYGVEGEKYSEGLNLLDISTTFGKDKITKQRRGRILAHQRGETDGIAAWCEDTPVEGYEIHMGQTVRGKDVRPWIRLEGADSFLKGTENEEHPPYAEEGSYHGNVYGTYLHGIFENVDFTQKLLQGLCEKKGLTGQRWEKMDYGVYREQQFDLLAQTVRQNVDLEEIYKMMELESCRVFH